MNLLTKLAEKFKNINNETKKRVVATVLAGSIALSGLGIVGCAGCNPDPNNTNPPIVTPGGDNGETQTPGGNGGGQTPGGNGGSQTPGGNSGSQTPDYSKFSQILQNVLTDSLYFNLINSTSVNTYNNPVYQPIPYGFLEDEGFDIVQIKRKNLKCTSELFSIENDLYVELKAEIEASTNYMANYILKYTLTQQEMNEMKNLFTEISISSFEEGTYYQAPFFVQELSYLRDPEVLSVSYATDICNEGANEFFDKKEMIGGSHISTYIKREPVENSQTIYYYYLVRPKTAYSKYSSKVGVVKMFVIGDASFTHNNRTILNYQDLRTSGKLKTEDRENFNNNIYNIISYTTRNHYFIDITKKNALENVFGK